MQYPRPRGGVSTERGRVALALVVLLIVAPIAIVELLSVTDYRCVAYSHPEDRQAAVADAAQSTRATPLLHPHVVAWCGGALLALALACAVRTPALRVDTRARVLVHLWALFVGGWALGQAIGAVLIESGDTDTLGCSVPRCVFSLALLGGGTAVTCLLTTPSALELKNQ